MKTKTGRISMAAAIGAMLVLVIGMYDPVCAREGKHGGKRNEGVIKIDRDSNCSVAPGPLVDDAPINPNTFAPDKNHGDSSGNRENLKKPNKTRSRHRD